jgi:hypothetical protein
MVLEIRPEGRLDRVVRDLNSLPTPMHEPGNPPHLRFPCREEILVRHDQPWLARRLGERRDHVVKPQSSALVDGKAVAKLE